MLNFLGWDWNFIIEYFVFVSAWHFCATHETYIVFKEFFIRYDLIKKFRN